LGTKYEIISADSHVNPQPSMWAEYLPARYRDRVPVVEHAEEGDAIIFEGKRTLYRAISAAAGKKAEEKTLRGRLEDGPAGGWDPHERLKAGDLDGVDAEVLFGGGPLPTGDPELYLASFRAYNTWLADFCQTAPDRLLGVAYIPILDIDAAIEELKFAAARGLRGGLIPPYPPSGRPGEGDGPNTFLTILTGDSSGERSYADPQYDRYWQTTIDLGLPVHMHLGARRNRHGPVDYFYTTLMTKLAMAEPIAMFIFSNLLARFPELKLVSVEASVGWFPFIAEYMDTLWRKNRFWANSPLQELPSGYMDRQVYGTFIEDRTGIDARHQPGVRKIMWSTDFPHTGTSWPNSLQKIDELFEGVPEDEKYPIVCGTVMDLYRLKQ
jgi:predicted TIM-barrel fold metal-dependent hydrolase